MKDRKNIFFRKVELNKILLHCILLQFILLFLTILFIICNFCKILILIFLNLNVMKRSPQQSKDNQSLLISNNANCTPRIFACQCHERLSNIEEKIQFMQLKLQQLDATLNLQYTKYMQCFSKLVELEKKQEDFNYTVWQLKQIMKNDIEALNTNLKKNQHKFTELEQKIKALNNSNKNSSNLKLWDHKLQNFKELTDSKLKLVFQTVEEIGNLQQKMLENSIKQTKMNNKMINQSTAIGYSKFM